MTRPNQWECLTHMSFNSFLVVLLHHGTTAAIRKEPMTDPTNMNGNCEWDYYKRFHRAKFDVWPAASQITAVATMLPLAWRGLQRRFQRKTITRRATEAIIIRKRRWPPSKRPTKYRRNLSVKELILDGSTGMQDDADEDYGLLNLSAVHVIGEGPMGLRGGGPHPAAGVLRWLEESDTEDTANENRSSNGARRGGSDANDDDQPHGERNHMGGASSAAEERDQGAADQQPQLRRDSDRQKPMPMVIRGRIGETETVMCNLCYQDWPTGDGRWTSCRCGAIMCHTCTLADGPLPACTWCDGSEMRSGPAAHETGEVDISREMHRGTEADNQTWDPWNFPRPQEAEDGENEVQTTGGERSPTVTGTEASNGACLGCFLPRATAGAEWYICRCGAWYCLARAASPCLSCPSLNLFVETAFKDPSHSATSTFEQTVSAANEERRRAPQTPEEINQWRCRRIKEIKEEQKEARTRSRLLRKQQIKDGLRPKRDRERDSEIILITANATCHNSLKKELQDGDDLKNADYLMLQEHTLRDEQRIIAEGWCRKQGLDAMLDQAYVKLTKNGGGTGILANKGRGIRPTAPLPDELEGRLSVGIGQLDGEVVICSWYGVSGASMAAQMRYIILMSERLKALGLPFVVGGDWQVTPAQLEATGITGVLNAAIVAPKGATNLRSKRKIDFFLVSNSLLQGGHRIRRLYGTNLATHTPVELKLSSKRTERRSMRLGRPRLLPTTRPFGPTAPRGRVN